MTDSVPRPIDNPFAQDARVRLTSHPLLRGAVTRLRHKDVAPPEFRSLVRRLATGLFLEATADLATDPVVVPTPLAPALGVVPAERIGLFPILRAALGMVEPLLELVPDARVRHLGVYRDHDTHRPVFYYDKLPDRVDLDTAFVLDPMLATGGSAGAVLERLANLRSDRDRPLRCVFIGLLGGPEGVRNLLADFPALRIHLAALDSHLNAQAYIVPGLGDAGDRQFATF